MKLVKATAILFVIGGCAFLGYKFSRTLHVQESAQTSAPRCDQGLWEYVYNPGRLQVLDPCILVTGTVEDGKPQADGDFHILFRLDPKFESLLNEKNISRQGGHLILEPICQAKITQADAVEPCREYPGPYFSLEVGQRYRATGAYVFDTHHGWNELHPVTSIQPIQ